MPVICPQGHLRNRSTRSTFNPHFSYFKFLSPDSSDSRKQLPNRRAIILMRSGYEVHRDRPSHYAIADMQDIMPVWWQYYPRTPGFNTLAPSCWSDAKWDGAPSNYDTQIWYLPLFHNMINLDDYLVTLVPARQRQQVLVNRRPSTLGFTELSK